MPPIRLLLVGEAGPDRDALRAASERSGLGAEISAAGRSTGGEQVLDAARAVDCVIAAQGGAMDLVRALCEAGSHVPVILLIEHDELLDDSGEAGVTDFLVREELTPRRVELRVRLAIRRAEAEAGAIARATRAARARDDVLSIVSHDLRGPLHAIGLATEALRDEVPANVHRYLDTIDRAAGRAERLIHELLEANAVEKGSLQIARFPVDAGTIVKQAAADHEISARDAGGQITVLVPPEPIVVSADRDRVLQLLGNLIGNAIKHARGAPIELSLGREGDEAVIAVRDRGPGIPDTELPHVLDRYWAGRTKKGGAGLGLAIAKGIVDAHAGTMRVSSTPGEGAEFIVTLPLAR